MEFRRLFDILPFQAARYPQSVALAKRENGRWKNYSTVECLQLIDQLSSGVKALGLKKGDRIAIATHGGSPAWNLLDFASQQIGLVSVPIHGHLPPAQIQFIFKEAEIKFCLVGSDDIYERIKSVQNQLPHLKYLYGLPDIPDLPHWSNLMKLPTDADRSFFDASRAAIHEDDLATIIYTSGTSGQPKGVMLSHKNMVSNIKSIISLIPLDQSKRMLSFLPLSHVFERMVTYTGMALGTSIHYADSVEAVMNDIREVKPHFFSCVPRFLEKLYEHILFQKDQYGGLKKRLLHFSIELGQQLPEHRRLSPWRWMQWKMADLLVFSQWRRLLGGHIEGIIVGAAALNPLMGRLFNAAGIDIREGYGLTETSPVVAFNRFEPGGVRFGTVGIPIPGVEVKIKEPDEEAIGEILVRGPNVMMGYYQQEGLTRQVLDEEGWFHTGDLGRFVHRRFLQIADRKKDIFKTSSGKYVAPQAIELLLRAHPAVDHCMVVGFNRAHVSALIVPSFRELKKWSEANDVHWTSPQFMVINPKITAHFDDIIEEINQQLESHEKVRSFHLLFEDWSIETAELTPTLKLRRSAIEKKYAVDIEKMYGGKK